MIVTSEQCVIARFLCPSRVKPSRLSTARSGWPASTHQIAEAVTCVVLAVGRRSRGGWTWQAFDEVRSNSWTSLHSPRREKSAALQPVVRSRRIRGDDGVCPMVSEGKRGRMGFALASENFARPSRRPRCRLVLGLGHWGRVGNSIRRRRLMDGIGFDVGCDR